ncbi:MAG: nucleoside monophosphate kinase [Candidatus Wildermuthbacteria bacterium]|nr:nucleoside monophosphate kinase [Candidatus Wildermuthbacteria bacterium]
MIASDNPYLIIFLGAPGSGKGTQTILTAEKFKLLRVEMSKLLEQRFAHAKSGETIIMNGTQYLMADQMKRWQKGFLVEAAVVSKILEQKLKELLERGENIILDGFPRSVEQMEFVMEFLEKEIGKDRMLIFYLDVTEESSLQRNSHRRICELMRHPVLSHPDTEKLTICPLDGSRLISRALDDPEVVKVRLQEFRKQTLPLLDYFEQKGVVIHKINGEQSVADVFGEISGIMSQALPQGV